MCDNFRLPRNIYVEFLDENKQKQIGKIIVKDKYTCTLAYNGKLIRVATKKIKFI